MELPLRRCTIRSWRPGDAGELASAANDRSIWINLRDRFPFPYTVADADTFIASASAALPETNFAITVDGHVAGAMGLVIGDDIYRASAEVGYWLGAAWRGRGIGTEALQGFSAWAFDSLPLVRLHAAVFVWNPPSARILEKAGFTRESTARQAAIKDGMIVDEWIYVRLREENRGTGAKSPDEFHSESPDESPDEMLGE